MRSSKKRSRSNQNRPRSLGNIVNRVFDSSGPEGKVRGTPQQIIEKYNALARDAQLSNDRVAAENFLQHSEHYTRLLAEAQRELAAEQEARQQFQQNGNQNGGHHSNGGNQNGNRERNDRDRGEPRDRGEFRDRGQNREQGSEDRPVFVEGPAEVIDLGSDSSDAGLAEVPEAGIMAEPWNGDTPAAEEGRPPRAPRGPRNTIRGERPPRAPRAPRGEGPSEAAEAPAEAPAPAEAAGDEVPARAKRERRPRKPRAEGDAPAADQPPSAAAE